MSRARAFACAWALVACEGSEPAAVRCQSQGGCVLPGQRCVSSIECDGGLVCNHGELPEELDTGLCRARAGFGEPCGYEHAPAETLKRVLPSGYVGIDRGDCARGLWCVPRFAAAGDDDAPPECEDFKGVPCFFSGVCARPGSVALGAPCATSESCASEVCAVFEEPLTAVPMPGFDASGRWLGPHVGRCVGAGDAIDSCRRGIACPDDFTCLDRECVAPHTLRPGAFCSEIGGDECAFGLECREHYCRR